MEMKEIFKEHADAVEASLKEIGVDVDVIRARMDVLEQKAARRGPRTDFRPSAGFQFVQDDEVKAFIGNARAGRRLSVEMKAIITSATTDADGSAGDVLGPYVDRVYPGAKRRLTIRGLLPVVQVISGSVEYAKQTGFTNAAASVAEGATKPQSEIKYDLVQVPIRTIAHWVLASRQVLDDAPQLQGLIDTEMRYGLSYAEELQLLNGAGSGTDLNGIYTQATAFASPYGSTLTAANKIDVILAALLQNALANEPATGIIVHPSDWTEIRGIKNSDGDYIMGPPGADVEPRLFGLPVVATPAMAVDKFVVGNFQAATLYDRWEARVEISTEDSDNFRKNLVTVLAEERIGLAVKNAAAFTKGDFSDAITDLTS
jgi:HK97 family phage major capsid protein